MVGIDTADAGLSLGFAIKLRDGDDAAILNELLEPVMFAYDSGYVVFTGNAGDAVRLCEAIEPPAPVVVSETAYTAVYDRTAPPAVPFPRELSEDENGLTLKFIQILTGAPLEDEWTHDTSEALRTWQARNQCPETSELDERTWQSIVPNQIQWLRPGATGSNVKTMQAALAAHGYLSPKITGMWGVEMSDALRRWQSDNDVYPRLRIGEPEWLKLFGATR
jgi:hypothetical protein